MLVALPSAFQAIEFKIHVVIVVLCDFAHSVLQI